MTYMTPARILVMKWMSNRDNDYDSCAAFADVVMIDCHPQFVVDDIGRHTPGLENSL
jgi:hypothetical protein